MLTTVFAFVHLFEMRHESAGLLNTNEQKVISCLRAHWYVGSTEDRSTRLADHNVGHSPHTSKYRPWHLVWYCAFLTRAKAETFGRYLKTASGRAFQKKHFG